MARTTEITTISGQEYEDTGSSDKTRQTTKQAVKTGLFEIVVHSILIKLQLRLAALAVFQSEANKLQQWKLLFQAALGLEYIHKKSVVHGVLKLNN
ncbi:hypothetical protein PR001_g28627, partial [Phytophthora rubi]